VVTPKKEALRERTPSPKINGGVEKVKIARVGNPPKRGPKKGKTVRRNPPRTLC